MNILSRFMCFAFVIIALGAAVTQTNNVQGLSEKLIAFDLEDYAGVG